MPDPKKPSAEGMKAVHDLDAGVTMEMYPDSAKAYAVVIDAAFAPRIAALEEEIARLCGLVDVAEQLICAATTCERSEQWLAVADQFMLGYGSARAALAEGEKEGKA